MQHQEDKKVVREKLRLNPPMVILGMLVIVFVAFIVLSDGPPRSETKPASETAAAGPFAHDAIEAGGATDPAAGADSPSYSIDRVHRTLHPQEREQWTSDPNSYGFNENDRTFLEEHGVSESEARAMETILRENGID